MVWLWVFFVGLVFVYVVKVFKSDLDFRRFEEESMELKDEDFQQENKEEKTVFNDAETKEKSDLSKSVKALAYIQTMENRYENSKKSIENALQDNIKNFRKAKRLSQQKIEQALNNKNDHSEN
ncbi:hypothetical protein [Tamlana crocina]|uniref:Uncharacterized protein n=1 Tax=Tamlana crocina TaxID=393006 RepID=A0ABX1DF35_9FLAO|nr:hypothetical protein [Tamlana crocina]NJX14911.1 hypothetical protein [Tamlana crocina]